MGKSRDVDGTVRVRLGDSQLARRGVNTALRSATGRFRFNLRRNPLEFDQLNPAGDLLIALQLWGMWPEGRMAPSPDTIYGRPFLKTCLLWAAAGSTCRGGIMWRLFLAAIAGLAMAGCATSYTTPAAVRLSTETVLIGTTTAALSGGTFEVSAPDGSLKCAGTYDAYDTSAVLSAPFTCSDGRYGTVTVTRSPDRLSGTGTIALSDGSFGAVAFGKDAASAIEPAPTAAPPVSAAPALATAVPASSYGSGCQSTNTYGAISCATGRPRTTYVRGYYRRDGTYVRPYYRSRK